MASFSHTIHPYTSGSTWYSQHGLVVIDRKMGKMTQISASHINIDVYKCNGQELDDDMFDNFLRTIFIPCFIQCFTKVRNKIFCDINAPLLTFCFLSISCHPQRHDHLILLSHTLQFRIPKVPNLYMYVLVWFIYSVTKWINNSLDSLHIILLRISDAFVENIWRKRADL